MTSEREQKRVKFAKAGVAKARAKAFWPVLIAAAILVVGAAGYWVFIRPETAAGYDYEPVGNDDTAGSTIEMTDLPTPVAENGRLSLSAAAIKEKRLVRFTYGDKNVPVLAYAAPSGKIVTAISMCEPCRSDRFHIEGDELVCNACGTRWTLEDLQGISGGCPEYPPQSLTNQVTGDTVTIDAQAVLNWQPRA